MIAAREYRTKLDDSGDAHFVNRLMIATPVTGLVRVEWVVARYGQVIPPNWSATQVLEWVDGYYPLRYNVADAQNLIAKQCVERDYEWLLLVEHDVLLPPDAFIRFNEWMRKGDTPIVSGLYYTRAYPPEPLVYRGRGNSYYGDWQAGDLVWCDGVPTGCLLVHGSIVKAVWAESEEYLVRGQKTRRVFDTPLKVWYDPESAQFNAASGTSDLDWCTRLIEGGYLAKAGWPEYQDKPWPLLVDTRISCKHISMEGVQYP